MNWRNSSASNCRSKQRRKVNTEQVAQKVVVLVRKQAWHEALDALYDKDIVSVEARTMDGSSPETRGIDGVRGKVDWWLENMHVHSFKADGPFVAHDRFVVQYDADVTDKNSKQRMQLSEVGVYTVKNGKIVREEFLPRV
ncbi:MAG: nuclear transport factor 2 family protein [Verrucomicrobia bacterium]|nr:MAG: nuclear transport factor 2 family protein [Verrucomicrobiota bacterium]